MKKSKSSEEWEDSPLVSSKSFQEEFDELDEEIIELDDEIIELPENGLEVDEETAFDVEILDADQHLDLKEGEGKAESEEEFLLEEDLLKELPFFQDQPAEAESAKTAPEEPESEEPGEAETELFYDSALLPPLPPEPSQPPAMEEPAGEEQVAAAVSQPEEKPAEPEPSLEDLMAQLEVRLLDAVRELVEARLPEIVRTVLREEIERLQKAEQTQN